MESAAGGGSGDRSEMIRSNVAPSRDFNEDKYPMINDATSSNQREKRDVSADLHELPTPNNNNQPLTTRLRSKSLTTVEKSSVDPILQSELILAALMGTTFTTPGTSRNVSNRIGNNSGRSGNVSRSGSISGKSGIGSGKIAVTTDSQSYPNYTPSPLLIPSSKPKEATDDISHNNEDLGTREQEPKHDEGNHPVNSVPVKSDLAHSNISVKSNSISTLLPCEPNTTKTTTMTMRRYQLTSKPIAIPFTYSGWSWE